VKKKKVNKHKKPRLKKKARAKKKTQRRKARTSCSHSMEDTVVTVANPAGRQIRLDWDDLNVIATWLSDLAGVNPDDVFPDFLIMYNEGFLDFEKTEDGWLATRLERSPEDWKRLYEIIHQVKSDLGQPNCRACQRGGQKCRRWNHKKEESQK